MEPMLETAAGGASSLLKQLQNFAARGSGPSMTEAGRAMAAAARGLGELNVEIGPASRPPSSLAADLAEAKAWAHRERMIGPVRERFPSAFGEVDPRDIERLSRHAIAKSYRRQEEIKAEPEAHRGAALMGMSGPPGSVKLSGGADIAQTLNIDITLDPGLHAVIDQPPNTDFSVPLAPADTGRMDGDAAPQRRYGHL